MNYKKGLAVALSATMALGSSTVVFAADQTSGSTGSGDLEYVAVSDVFDVVFPTKAEGDTTFNYILDPDGLIAETDGEKYTGKAFDDDKTMYFLRTAQVDGTVGGSAGKVDYTDSSDEIEVINKSTEDITLTVEASVDAVEGITMATSKTFADTKPAIYLAISGKGTDDAAATETAITGDGVKLTPSVKADAAAYEVKWNDTTKQYEKTMTDAAKAADYAGFKSYKFQLTGACNNTEGTDWTGLEDKAPAVDLVWSVKDFTVKAPEGPSMTVSESGLITVTGLTAEKNYKMITLVASKGENKITDSQYTFNQGEWTAEDGGDFTIQLGTAWMEYLDGQEVTFTLVLTDDTTTTATVTLAK